MLDHFLVIRSFLVDLQPTPSPPSGACLQVAQSWRLHLIIYLVRHQACVWSGKELQNDINKGDESVNQNRVAGWPSRFLHHL